MIIDYFVNFCDSEVCFDNNHRCTYPETKAAPIEKMFGTEADPNKKVTKCKIELEAHDKFHVYYPDGAQWRGRFKIANEIICEFSKECTSNMSYINIEFECGNILDLMAQDMNMECELYIDDDIVCPYNLSLLIYQED